MNAWLEGTVLTLALLAGMATGWFLGKRFSLRMPNVAIATLVLVAGSLGGPVLTEALLGRGLDAYLMALLIAGAAAGLTFWPMGEKQGEQKWL